MHMICTSQSQDIVHAERYPINKYGGTLERISTLDIVAHGILLELNPRIKTAS